MTIAIGFRFANGVMVCSDSEYTAGTLKMSGQKVFRAAIGTDKLIFTMAGSVAYARMAVEKVVHSVSAMPETKRTKANIRSNIESSLLKLHEKHIYKHPFFQHQGGPDFNLIIGVWSHLDGLDFFSQIETALTDIVDFHCTGIGEDLSRFVIKSIFRHRSLSIWDAANVAIHVLRITKENVTACGGRDQFAYLTNEGIMGSSFGSHTSGTQHLSEAFSESVRRLYLWMADLDSPDSKLDDELLLLKSALTDARIKVDDEKRFQVQYTLEDIQKIEPPPDFAF